MRLWAQGFYSFVTPGAARFLNVLAFIGGLTLVATVKLWYERALGAIRDQPILAATVGVSGTALVGETVAYLAGKAPVHAAGWEYIIWFWPAIVVLGAGALRRCHWARSALVLLVGAALLVTSSARWERLNNYSRISQRRTVTEVTHATLVIDDCLERGTTPGAAMWVPRSAKFLQLAPGDAVPPPIPRGADLARPLLFQGGGCLPRVANVEQSLAMLGFARSVRIGPIGLINVYRLQRR